MPASIYSRSVKRRQRSWGGGVINFLCEFADVPDDGMGVLILAGIILAIILIAAISAVVEAWSNPILK